MAIPVLLREELFNISLGRRRLKSCRGDTVAKSCLYCRWVREQQHRRNSLTILRGETPWSQTTVVLRGHK